MVGDQKQLPATVVSQLAQHCGYGRSMFERLGSQGHPFILLSTQYRCAKHTNNLCMCHVCCIAACNTIVMIEEITHTCQ